MIPEKWYFGKTGDPVLHVLSQISIGNFDFGSISMAILVSSFQIRFCIFLKLKLLFVLSFFNEDKIFFLTHRYSIELLN